MTTPHKQELQIVQAFSSVDVPEKILRESNIKELIMGMAAEQDSVQSDTERLERLRQAKKNGNIISNWWHNRDDKVQDAQIDLNKSIGRLTHKSSQLLVVNTAISKVLSDQQRLLLEQQNILKRQTDTLEEQNRKILEQQKLLEKQQRDINQANQGLMDAKGVTQEQAQQLVGCVKRVTEAEKRIDTTAQALRIEVEQRMDRSVEQCLSSLNTGFAQQEQQQSIFEQQLNGAFSAQSRHLQDELEGFTEKSARLESTLEQWIQSASAELDSRHAAYEQQTRSELQRMAEDTASFSAGIEQLLQTHTQTIAEKNAAQDAATQELAGNFSTQLQVLHKNMVSVLDQKAMVLRDIIKGIEFKQEAAQQQQAWGMDAQRASLEQDLQQLEVRLNDKVEERRSAEAQLAIRQAGQQESAGRQRRALAVVACLSVVSLGWQIVRHFSLI